MKSFASVVLLVVSMSCGVAEAAIQKAQPPLATAAVYPQTWTARITLVYPNGTVVEGFCEWFGSPETPDHRTLTIYVPDGKGGWRVASGLSLLGVRYTIYAPQRLLIGPFKPGAKIAGL